MKTKPIKIKFLEHSIKIFKTILKYTLVFFVICLCFGYLELQFLKLSLRDQTVYEYTYLPDLTYLKLDRALKEAASAKYTSSYNCVEFSHDLVDRLERIGIKAELEMGIGPEDGCHMWVSIWVEPQRGEFIRPHEDYSEDTIRCGDK